MTPDRTGQSGADDRNVAQQEAFSTDDVLDFVWRALTSLEMPDNPELIAQFSEHMTFQRLLQFLQDLRILSDTLNRGSLDTLVYSRGFVLSNLKALQSNLRHLTWQTKKIADGDFSQKVDFLGDFSKSFNEMTVKLSQFSKQLHTLANFDQLTQIPNRHYLHEFLSKCFEQYMRDHMVFSILMIDIDFFKKVNDTYGHDAGDRVLVQISDILNANFRASDLLARYGGEEFLAVLMGTNVELAHTIAQRARRAVEQTAVSLNDDEYINVTISIGVSVSDPADSHYEAIIKRSDDALYEAKNTGRNRVVVR